jgi:hypothetical protein
VWRYQDSDNRHVHRKTEKEKRSVKAEGATPSQMSWVGGGRDFSPKGKRRDSIGNIAPRGRDKTAGEREDSWIGLH